MYLYFPVILYFSQSLQLSVSRSVNLLFISPPPIPVVYINRFWVPVDRLKLTQSIVLDWYPDSRARRLIARRPRTGLIVYPFAIISHTSVCTNLLLVAILFCISKFLVVAPLTALTYWSPHILDCIDSLDSDLLSTALQSSCTPTLHSLIVCALASHLLPRCGLLPAHLTPDFEVDWLIAHPNRYRRRLIDWHFQLLSASRYSSDDSVFAQNSRPAGLLLGTPGHSLLALYASLPPTYWSASLADYCWSLLIGRLSVRLNLFY